MNKPLTGRIFDIQKFSVTDGPGVRTTVFFKGCNLRCRWCHNPESQHMKRELLFYKEKCTACGSCARHCRTPQRCALCGSCTHYCPTNAREIAGRDVEAEALVAEIMADRLFYESSGGGVTFSGGECLLQADFLLDMLQRCKEQKLHTAVDTAGAVPYEVFEKILPYTDLFLYDIKCIDEELHLAGTGVSNRLILENLRRLSRETSCEIIVRIPVVGGFNDSDEELRRMADFLRPLRLSAVEPLAYHKMGEGKYAALGLVSEAFTVPSEEKVARVCALLCNP